MDERTKFIGRLLAGEKMAPLCREFGITRRTGYKIWERYQQDGNTGLYNRSRAPHRHPNQTPFEVEKLIVRLKTDKPSWGAPKIREIIINKYPSIPNDLWCTDFKGEFKLGNHAYCYPLTLSDQVSRFLLVCESLESTA